jgi:four helix bundle protein
MAHDDAAAGRADAAGATRQPTPTATEPWLDAEKLDAYRVSLEFQALMPALMPQRGCAALRDQLERASSSISLNLAEGAGRTAPADKARFYAIARGSAMESAAALDVLLVRGVADPVLCRRGRGLLVRVVQMLTRLIARMQQCP